MWTGVDVTFARMRLRQYLWRLVAALILVGTVTELTLGVLFLTGIKRMVSFGVLQAIYWTPPAIERPSSLLHFLGHVNSTIAWMALLLTVICSLVLAYGLWKERLWAGWIETALILFRGVVLVNIWWRYFAARGALGLSEFFMVGNGPSLLWVLVIMALLWTDQLLRLLGNPKRNAFDATAGR
jgi:hypothetical protein